MFGTLHWNSRRKETEFIKQTHATLNRERNSACDRCRLHKVKCHTSNDGCSRCMRFRKACTFTAASKQQAGLRAGKGKSPLSQHERQLDFRNKSSDHIDIKDQQQQEYQQQEQQQQQQQQSPQKPSTPSTDGTYDSDQRQDQDVLPGLSDESNASSFFDVSSFLDTFSHHRSDQEAAFAFFSPPETLLSPPASLGDESTHRFTLPDVGVTGVDSSSLANCNLSVMPVSSSAQCQCLAAAALAVEEFETSCNHGTRAQLDSIIAYQKKAIRCCRLMINCTSCSRRRENNVLLIFITEKVVAACTQVVMLYSARESPLEAHTPFGSSTELSSLQDHNDFHSQPWGLDTHSPSSMHSPQSTSLLTGWKELLVGDYEVSSQMEWENLMRVLVSVQLRAVMEVLANTRRLKSDVLTEVQAASLARSQNSVSKLENQISFLF